MIFWNHGRLWSKSVLHPVKIHYQLVKVYGVCVIPWKVAGTMYGFQQWHDRCWQVVTWAPSIIHYRWCVAYRHIQLLTFDRGLDIHWEVHRIVRNLLDYREVCAHWVPENPTDDDRAHCMGLYGPFLYPLDMLHWSKGEKFWSWNMVNYTKPETRKRMCDRGTIISLQQRKWKHCYQ